MRLPRATLAAEVRLRLKNGRSALVALDDRPTSGMITRGEERSLPTSRSGGMADALGSGPSILNGCAGSSPVFGTLTAKGLRRKAVTPLAFQELCYKTTPSICHHEPPQQKEVDGGVYSKVSAIASPFSVSIR